MWADKRLIKGVLLYATQSTVRKWDLKSTIENRKLDWIWWVIIIRMWAKVNVKVQIQTASSVRDDDNVFIVLFTISCQCVLYHITLFIFKFPVLRNFKNVAAGVDFESWLHFCSICLYKVVPCNDLGVNACVR